MVVAAPSEGYARMIAYGQHKSALRLDQLALQSCLAGFWVAIYGHACTIFASHFYNVTEPSASTGVTKMAYGMLFPGAFVAVVYTGTELFTGNTVTMFMLCFNDGRKAVLPLIRIWTFSLCGNLAGAVFGAFIMSYCSGVFFTDSRAQLFLFNMAKHKIENGFGQNIVLGIGCNALVCLATWCVVVSDDGAGKILAIFYSIGVFAMGGFEHIVANFYTLTAAHFIGYNEHTFGETLYKNWVPVLLGNLMAGTLFTGMLWWYALHPQYTELSPFTNVELARELSRRVGSVSAYPATDATGLRWQQSKLTEGNRSTSQSFFIAPHHLVPTPLAGVQSSPTQDFSIFIGQGPTQTDGKRKPSSSAAAAASLSPTQTA